MTSNTSDGGGLKAMELAEMLEHNFSLRHVAKETRLEMAEWIISLIETAVKCARRPAPATVERDAALHEEADKICDALLIERGRLLGLEQAAKVADEHAKLPFPMQNCDEATLSYSNAAEVVAKQIRALKSEGGK